MKISKNKNFTSTDAPEKYKYIKYKLFSYKNHLDLLFRYVLVGFFKL